MALQGFWTVGGRLNSMNFIVPLDSRYNSFTGDQERIVNAQLIIIIIIKKNSDKCLYFDNFMFYGWVE